MQALNNVRDRIYRRLELGKCSITVGKRYERVLRAIVAEQPHFLHHIFVRYRMLYSVGDVIPLSDTHSCWLVQEEEVGSSWSVTPHQIVDG